ncbi:MAG: hypothetical protein ACXV5Q_14565, partial [Frankiaceae bacterium]
MSRRGRARSFDGRPRPGMSPRPPRIGQRIVRAVRPDNVTIVEITMSPTDFACTQLAADMADGWVANRAGTVDGPPRAASAGSECLILRNFLRYVEQRSPAERARLSLATLPLALISDWEGSLFAGSSTERSGEMRPANRAHTDAAVVFATIRAAGSAGVPVSAALLDRARHPPLTRYNPHACTQVPGFTDAEDRLLKTTFQHVVYRTANRIREAGELVRDGRDPRTAGWNSLPNIAWAAVHGGFTVGDLADGWLAAGVTKYTLDPAIVELRGREQTRKQTLASTAQMTRARVYRLPFPTADELLAGYFLLLQLTGAEPSWVRSLTIDAVTVTGPGYALRGFKHRHPTEQMRERVFPRVPGSRLSVPRLWDLIIEITQFVRVHRQTTNASDARHLWLAVDGRLTRTGLMQTFVLARWWETHGPGSALSSYDTRSFRQTHRSRDAIDTRGEDLIADPVEHSVDVFLNHYADDPRLLVLTLESLASYQRNVFDHVVHGRPEAVSAAGVVISSEMFDRLAAGDPAARNFVKATTGAPDRVIDMVVSGEELDLPVGAAC